jgi:hypothetical protein
MATDFLLGGYQALKALLLADAALTDATTGIRMGNFVWFDGTDPQPEPEGKKGAKQPGDFPELKLDWEEQTDTMRTQTTTFGNTGPGSSCPFIAAETHVYSVTLTVDDSRLQRSSALVNHVKRILRAGSTVTVGGYRAFVGQITARNERTAGKEAKGRKRRIVRLRVPLSVRYDGSTQTT